MPSRACSGARTDHGGQFGKALMRESYTYNSSGPEVIVVCPT